MLLDRAKEGHAPAVVEQFGARSNAPEGRRAQFVGSFLAASLHDTVAGPNVVQQEIAVRVKDFVAQCRWDMDRASRDGCSGRGRDDRGDVANVTADAVE